MPWPSTRPRDPFSLDGKTVWFCGQVGHYLARLDTASCEFTKIDLPDPAGPHNLIIDAQGIVWYAGNLRGYIGRLDPASGAIEKIPMIPKTRFSRLAHVMAACRSIMDFSG